MVRPLPRPARRTSAVAIGLLLILVAAVYWPAAGFGFIPFDDDTYVYRNPLVLGGLTSEGLRWSFTTLEAGYWIPLTWLSLMADASLWGPGAGGFHLTNVLLHAVAALLLFVLLRRVLGSGGVPLLAAALFAVHPLHVESVCWVTERKDVLSQTFFLGFANVWVAHLRRRSIGRHAAALLLLALSLMAKPVAATAPMLLLVLDGWPLGRLRRGAALGPLLREKAPTALVALGFGVLAVATQHRSGALVPVGFYTPVARLANASVTLAQNLARALWPAGLSPFYPPPPGGSYAPLPAAGALAALVTLAVASHLVRRRAPWLPAGLAWYALALAPLSGVLQAGSQVGADRFTYLPLLGVHLAGACFVLRAGAVAGRRWGWTAALLLPVLFGLAAHRQALNWRDGTTLLGRAATVARDSSLVQNNLGAALVEAGRLDEALARFEAAARIDPRDVLAQRNIGGVLGALGRSDEGAEHLRRAAALAPENAEVRVELGDLLLGAGRLEEAEREYAAALALDASGAPALSGLSALRLAQGRLPEARALATEAVAKGTRDARAWYLLGTAEARLGDPSSGERHLRRALALEPDRADAGYNLALALIDQGRLGQARELLDALVVRHPADAGLAELRDRTAAAVP